MWSKLVCQVRNTEVEGVIYFVCIKIEIKEYKLCTRVNCRPGMVVDTQKKKNGKVSGLYDSIKIKELLNTFQWIEMLEGHSKRVSFKLRYWMSYIYW